MGINFNAYSTAAYLINQMPQMVDGLLGKAKSTSAKKPLGEKNMIDAVVSDDIDQIKAFLKKGGNVNDLYPIGVEDTLKSPLHVALICNNLQAARYLITRGADVNQSVVCKYNPQDPQDKPLHLAIKSGNLGAVRLLMQAGADVDAIGAYNQTPLILAYSEGDLEILQTMIDWGADLNLKGHFNLNILHQAIHKDDLKMVQWLLELGADPNIETGGSLDTLVEMPIHMAVKMGSSQMVEVLSSYGADLNVQDEEGISPLHRAVENSHPTIVRFLLSHQVDPDLRDSSNKTPLDWAARKRNLEIIQLLISAQADSLSTNSKGETLLHAAMMQQESFPLESDSRNQETSKADLALLEMLVENSQNLDQRDHSGQAPLHIAASKGEVSALQMLLKAGADVDIKDHQGQSPLHKAALYGKGEALLLLLEAGADACSRDREGQTVLHCVAKEIKHGHEITMPGGYDRFAEYKEHFKFGFTLQWENSNFGPMLTKSLTEQIGPSLDEIVDALVKKGGDLLVQDHNGKTPIELAKQYDPSLRDIPYIYRNENDSLAPSTFEKKHSRESLSTGESVSLRNK